MMWIGKSGERIDYQPFRLPFQEVLVFVRDTRFVAGLDVTDVEDTGVAPLLEEGQGRSTWG